MNHIRTIASVTAEPELRYSSGGNPVLTIPTANVSEHNGHPVHAYRPIKVFGKQAETIATLLEHNAPGTVLSVEGRLNQNRWEDQEGNKRNDLEVIASRITILDSAQFEMRDDRREQPVLQNGKNEVELVGNLTKDIEVVELATGIVAKGALAVNEYFKDRSGERQERTHFVDFEAWDEAATALQGQAKGRGVLVRGPLVTQSWEGQDGKRRFKTLLKVTEAYLRPARK